MGFGKALAKGAPAIALAAIFALSGCGDASVSIDGEEGVPLADLDMEGASPSKVALVSSDTMIIRSGETFDIQVEGSEQAVDRLRFVLTDDTIGVQHTDGDWDNVGNATITVTMPPPNSVNVLGSGSLTADGMSNDASINLVGSGSITVSDLAASDLEIAMPGSGRVTASGSAERLDLNVLGSGSADMPDLTVADAEVTVAGSGGAQFASNGVVEARILGSGTVRVTGDASCTEESLGSGSLICAPAATRADVASAQ